MLRYERKKIMSINSIPKEEKLEVLIRLITSNEKFDTACSKSGLTTTEAKTLLAK